MRSRGLTFEASGIDHVGLIQIMFLALQRQLFRASAKKQSTCFGSNFLLGLGCNISSLLRIGKFDQFFRFDKAEFGSLLKLHYSRPNFHNSNTKSSTDRYKTYIISRLTLIQE